MITPEAKRRIGLQEAIFDSLTQNAAYSPTDVLDALTAQSLLSTGRDESPAVPTVDCCNRFGAEHGVYVPPQVHVVDTRCTELACLACVSREPPFGILLKRQNLGSVVLEDGIVASLAAI